MKTPRNQQSDTPLSLQGIGGQPETAEELVNKYGTYEIQPTADSENAFPAIAQGLAKEEQKKHRGWRGDHSE